MSRPITPCSKRAWLAVLTCVLLHTETAQRADDNGWADVCPSQSSITKILLDQIIPQHEEFVQRFWEVDDERGTLPCDRHSIADSAGWDAEPERLPHPINAIAVYALQDARSGHYGAIRTVTI